MKRRAPLAPPSGEREAILDPARGRFREVRSRVAFTYEGAFDGGRGGTEFERRIVAREDGDAR
jgi:hypothetical protein